MNVESIQNSDTRKLIVFHKNFALVYPFFLCLWSFNKYAEQAMHHNLYSFTETFCCQWQGHTK